MTVYIRYDNQSLQDGLGAQALRIMGVYSIARTFRLRYLHAEIQSTVEEFSHSHDTQSNQTTLDKFNDFFRFPSFVAPIFFSKTYNFRSLTRKQLLQIMFHYSFTKKNVLIIVLLPFAITDKYPFIFRHASEVLRKRELNMLELNDVSKIQPLVAHIRFGYGWMYGEQSHVKKRQFLSPRYFTEVINSACSLFSIPNSLPLLIHTDLSKFDTIWKPQSRETIEGFRLISGDPNAETLLIKGRNLSDEIDIPQEYSLDVRYCADTYEAFLDMCRARVLIMGTSTFSYLAGLINSNIVVWPSIHGHSKLPGWYSELDLGINVSDAHIEHVV